MKIFVFYFFKFFSMWDETIADSKTSYEKNHLKIGSHLHVISKYQNLDILRIRDFEGFFNGIDFFSSLKDIFNDFLKLDTVRY